MIPTMKTFQVLHSFTLLGVAVVNGQEEIVNNNAQLRLNDDAEVCFGGSKPGLFYKIW
jgi:hypothetical protein